MSNKWNRNKKIKQTCLTKYGVENVYQAEFVKEKKKGSKCIGCPNSGCCNLKNCESDK